MRKELKILGGLIGFMFLCFLVVGLFAPAPEPTTTTEPVKVAPTPTEPVQGTPEWWAKNYPKLTNKNPVTGYTGVLDRMSENMLIYKDGTAYWGVNLLAGKEYRNGVEVYGYDPQYSGDILYFPVR